MRESLVHRGPDDAGLWVRDGGAPFVGLAHRRLSIIDLSESARQPMFYGNGNLAVVFNGEIYNYIELRKELEGLGCFFVTRSDTEVLLAAYDRWGEACLERLNGMFAFALWDERRQSLFAARDRFGKKPFFYYHRDGRFYFASEMKALFRVPGIPCRPDTDALDRYVQAFRLETGEETLFEGIRRLKPSEALLLTDTGRVKRWRYWQLEETSPARVVRLEEAEEEFRALFSDSVGIRLRADVPLGSSLSGGLDSSAIVCTLAEQLGAHDNHGLKTFSARFPDDAVVDEGEYIDALVRKAGVDAHRVTPSPEGLKGMIRQMHYYQEEPFLSSSIFAQWEVMRLARKEQVTILLDGQGGDEILAGYIPYVQTYFLDLFLSMRWYALMREVIPFLAMQRRAVRSYKDASQRFYVLTPLGLARAVLGPYVQKLKGAEGPLPARAEGPRFRDRLTEQLYRDLTEISIPLLLRYADRNAMAFSREVRNPFLDHRLVEYLFSLPSGLKIRHGWNKFLLRHAMRGMLPEKIRKRFDKVGYVTPECRWLRGPIREWAQGILFGDALRSLKGYPEKRVKIDWEEHQRGTQDNRWKIWPWISLAVWLGMVRDGVFEKGGIEPPAGQDGPVNNHEAKTPGV